MTSAKRISRIATVVAAAGAVAFAIGIGYYQLGWDLLLQQKAREQATALRLTDAFVATYSGVRRSHMQDDAPVPATFRAEAIKAFNLSDLRRDGLTLAMVGVPGEAIKNEPTDPAMADAVAALAREAAPVSRTMVIRNGGETVIRTMHPSIAKAESCVACHNRLQGPGAHWRLNDVMGAFVVDAPATAALAALSTHAWMIGAVAFLTLSSGGLYMQSALRRRRLDGVRDGKRRIKDAYIAAG